LPKEPTEASDADPGRRCRGGAPHRDRRASTLSTITRPLPTCYRSNPS